MPRSAGQGSLFERLDPDRPPRRIHSRQELAAERISAIKQHLEWMLNTRCGDAQSCPDLGLSDLNDAAAGSADLRLRICADIRRAVVRFEPRIEVLDVVSDAAGFGPMGLSFKIQGCIPVNNQEEQVEIDLFVRGQGQAARAR